MGPSIFEQARILVVDDEPQNVRYLEDVLGWAGYTRVETTSDPLAAVPLFRETRPDLVILDLLMPGLDGFEILEQLGEELDDEAYLPVLVLTADTSREARRKAMNAGARDFLTKPMSPTEVRLRVRNLLEARFLYLECRRLRGDGAGDAEEFASERGEILERWARLIEYGSPEDDQHAKRVAWTAAKVADALDLPSGEVELIRDAALLHDIGKAALRAQAGRHGGVADGPDALLDHPEVGQGLLSGARAPVLRLATEIAAGHHERWDGDGRPGGLSGEEVPLPARIVAVADAFDRFRYGPDEREASVEEALARVEGEAGRAFDPRVVRALVESYAPART